MSRNGPNPLRQSLWPLGLCYGGAMALRNWMFHAGLRRVHRLNVPVVSVGNLTVGGTGKTPTVLWLAELARRHGRTPGVLARGYGRAAGALLNDEGQMLQQRLPWLLQEQDPDRVAAGRRLCQRGADYVILDDGFQHRRLGRDVDILCLDARQPFADGNVLPAGSLREFHTGLRRASLLLLTRAGGLDPRQLEQRREELRRFARAELPVHACDHAALDLVSQPDGALLGLEVLRDRAVVLLSAIARPQAFADTVGALGARVVQQLRHRDHHRFTRPQVESALQAARKLGAMLLCTEKDGVRLSPFAAPHHVLRIGLSFLGAEPAPAALKLS